jgi:protein-tyrosine phosphatase
MELEWTGELIILDESSFDHLILEKMTNQIFIASYLKNTTQFCKILDRHITAILNLNSKDEDYTISNYHLKTLCQQNNIQLKNWTVEELSSRQFLSEAEEIVAILEKLLVEGHRVCIHCSRKIMRSAPIHVLYLTMFVGYSLGEAIEQMGRDNPLSESGCKVVQDVFNLVHNKMNRGKISISTH